MTAPNEQTQAGYVLVPVEPTEEMTQAGVDQMPHFTDEPGPVWAAMLAAAPQAQTQAAPAGYVLAEQAFDCMELYKILVDAVAEAGAVDTVIGRPDVLRSKLAKVRDMVGNAANCRIPFSAAPQAQPVEAEQAENLRRDYARALDTIKGHAAQIGVLEQHIRELRAFKAMVNRHAPEYPDDPDGPRDVWYWQGDGLDHLESMVHQLPVVIRAEQLRELLAAAKAAALPAQPMREPMSDELIEALPVWKPFIGMLPKHRQEIARAIERACADRWGVKLAGITKDQP